MKKIISLLFVFVVLNPCFVIAEDKNSDWPVFLYPFDEKDQKDGIEKNKITTLPLKVLLLGEFVEGFAYEITNYKNTNKILNILEEFLKKEDVIVSLNPELTSKNKTKYTVIVDSVTLGVIGVKRVKIKSRL